MTPLTLLVLAIGLAMDAFSVAVATSVSLPRLSGRQVFRFAFHFGLFQALMPLLGWLCGQTVVEWVAAWDHWLALGLLTFVGGRAIWDGLRSGKGPSETGPRADPTRGWSLVVLSIATSIDAFAVGLSFAWLGVSLWLPVAVIGLVTALLTALGMALGRRVGARFGPRMSILGGLVLIAIGVKIVVDHLG
ncbi:MAG: manganese efflux pump MntP family protein [Polyangia bacterium]|jgi:putative Mn2+ efflux pump MntP|nr:manganese efflux pump MntP family protein [Polyangia bacterium]